MPMALMHAPDGFACGAEPPLPKLRIGSGRSRALRAPPESRRLKLQGATCYIQRHSPSRGLPSHFFCMLHEDQRAAPATLFGRHRVFAGLPFAFHGNSLSPRVCVLTHTLESILQNVPSSDDDGLSPLPTAAAAGGFSPCSRPSISEDHISLAPWWLFCLARYRRTGGPVPSCTIANSLRKSFSQKRCTIPSSSLRAQGCSQEHDRRRRHHHPSVAAPHGRYTRVTSATRGRAFGKVLFSRLRSAWICDMPGRAWL